MYSISSIKARDVEIWQYLRTWMQRYLQLGFEAPEFSLIFGGGDSP
jgi:hypothetical protein